MSDGGGDSPRDARTRSLQLRRLVAEGVDALLAAMPPWMAAACCNPRHWKAWIRTSVATFGMMIVLVCQPSLRVMGPGTFFGLITSQVLMPRMTLFIYFYVICLWGIGMCTGWAWGCAGMASANHVRSKHRLHRQMTEVQPNRARGKTVQVYPEEGQAHAPVQDAIFAGRFLDPGASALYGAFMFIGTVAIAIVRANHPKLLLFTIPASIILDVHGGGKSNPSRRADHENAIITPSAAAMACGLAAAVLFFPESINHRVLFNVLRDGIPPLLDALKVQDDVLTAPPGSTDAWDKLTARIKRNREQYLGAVANVELYTKMLQLEVSRGRIGPGQLQRLVAKLQDLGAQAYSLSLFASAVEGKFDVGAADNDTAPPRPSQDASQQEKHGRISEADGETEDVLKAVMPDLAASTADVRAAAITAFEGARDYLEHINKTRWSDVIGPFDNCIPLLQPPPPAIPGTEVRIANVQRLRAALDECKNSQHFKILDHYRDLFDLEAPPLQPSDIPRLASEVRGIFPGLMFVSTLLTFCTVLAEFLEQVVAIELAHPKTRIHLPDKFAHAVVENADDDMDRANNFNWSVEQDMQDNGKAESSADEDEEASLTDITEKVKRKQRKMRIMRPRVDAGRPKNAFQVFNRFVEAFIYACFSPSGIYSIKYGLLSIALNRFIWALIMSQTSMGFWTGEQVISFVSRLLGTASGMALAMVIWYAGNGRGDGNPYGTVIATMGFMMPVMFITLAAPPSQFGYWVLFCATVMLIVGYSWIDTHLPSTANQGKGAETAGRRGLMVVIGLTAAFIVVIFPRPRSSRRSVREGLSRNIASLSGLYTMDVMGLEWRRNERKPIALARHHALWINAHGRLAQIEAQMSNAKAEIDLMGPWPQSLYAELQMVQKQMLAASSLLVSCQRHLAQRWCERLTQHNDLLHPAFVADCLSLFTLLRHSLRTGLPLPATVPIFERLSYHRWNAHVRWIAVYAARRAGVLPEGVDEDRLQHPATRTYGGHGAREEWKRQRWGGDMPTVRRPKRRRGPPRRRWAGMQRKGKWEDYYGDSNSDSQDVSTRSGGAQRHSGDTAVSSGSSGTSGSSSSHDSAAPLCPSSRPRASSGVSARPARPPSPGDGKLPPLVPAITDIGLAKRPPPPTLRNQLALVERFANMLSWPEIHDAQFATYATVLIAMTDMIGALNDMHRIILRLVGEDDLGGFTIDPERG